MNEKWQLYDEQGRVLESKGANKDEIFTKGLLHAAAHVWIWRNRNNSTEVLLQKRSANKRTWPNLYDISAAGHIDLGEEPLTAALRETKEEIGLDIKDTDLSLITVERRNITAPSGAIENEFCWVYTLRLDSETEFKLEKSEVASLNWKKFSEFKTEVLDADQSLYVSHGLSYFNIVVSAIEGENK